MNVYVFTALNLKQQPSSQYDNSIFDVHKEFDSECDDCVTQCECGSIRMITPPMTPLDAADSASMKPNEGSVDESVQNRFIWKAQAVVET